MRFTRTRVLARAEHGDEPIDVVTVNRRHFPTESRELRCKVGRVAHIAGAAVNLQAVTIDDGRQVIEVAVGREHGGFPHLPLFAFPIAEEREHGTGLAVKKKTGRCTGGDGEPLPQRAS